MAAFLAAALGALLGVASSSAYSPFAGMPGFYVAFVLTFQYTAYRSPEIL